MTAPARLLLIRHGTNPKVGKGLTGWLPGVSLDENGRRQAEGLAQRMADLPVAAIYSSPLERARETAEPLARQKGLEIVIEPAFGEVNFGDWQGHDFPELEHDPLWRRFNVFRSGTQAPGGESMLETQARITRRSSHLRQDTWEKPWRSSVTPTRSKSALPVCWGFHSTFTSGWRFCPPP